LKILVTAYAFEPNKGSEPGAGWNIVRQIATRHQVWVVTRANNAAVIGRELERNPIAGLEVAYHDLPVLRRMKRMPGGVWWYHYLWHMSLRQQVRKLHDRIEFDLAHQLTFGSFRFPGMLHSLGIPTIIGPVGGSEEPPPVFWPGLGPEGFATELLRFASNRVALLDPLLRRSLRSASLVLAVSPETANTLRKIVAGRTPVQILPQSGVDPTGIPGPPVGRDPQPDGTCRVLQVGRLEGWKGAHLSIDAVALARRSGADVRLTILGTGPAQRRLVKRARSRNVEEFVEFIDRVPTLADVYALYRAHDVFLFPSLRESGGMALLEAMAAGLPGIALRIGGPAVSLTDDTGIRVAATRPGATVAAISEALVTLSEDRELRARLGAAAADRVKSLYAWEPKGSALEHCYVVATRGMSLADGSA
jgi:glycosyltransferase involved in cell wall biosynthesis